MHNQGLGSWPARQARGNPEAVAFVFEGAETSFGQFHDRVRRAANALRDAGVGAGDRVAYLGPNHTAFAETMFATHMINAIFVPLNFRLAAPEIEYMLEHSGARLLVYAPECAGTVAGLTGYSGVHVALSDPRAGESLYADFVAAGAPDDIDVPVSLEDPALILYTSGTTGRPKGAVLTHGNVLWNSFNMLLDVDVGSDEVTLISAPLFHVAALNQTLMTTFLKGATSVIMPTWDVERAFDLIEERGVTWMFGVTAMFAALTQSDRWQRADLSSVRTLMSGGAPIPESLIHRYQERGLVFCQGYGLTETSPGAAFLRADKSIEKVGSAGGPTFFGDIRVVDSSFADVPVGVPGEILIEGPNVFGEYWQNPQATEESFVDGRWFRSGDLGTLDEDGYLTVVDRVKDMYISGGENVYPAEVESILFTHPDVAECAVIGVPDQRWGEVGAAYVVVRDGGTADPDEVREYLRARLAKYKVPVQVHVAKTLPRTGSGKIRKPTLRRAYESGGTGSAD